MKGEEFLDKMGLIDPEFIEKAETEPKKHRILKWVSTIAACICIFIAVGRDLNPFNADVRWASACRNRSLKNVLGFYSQKRRTI